MAGEQMGSWPSGFDWYLTIKNPTIYGVQGELIYVLALWFPFPSFFIIKIFGVALVVSLLAKLFGYDIAMLLRRVKRFYIGRKRPIYSSRNNFLRTKVGV